VVRWLHCFVMGLQERFLHQQS